MDQLDVVKIVSLVAFVGKRLLIILQGNKERQEIRGGNNELPAYEFLVLRDESRNSASS